MKRYVSASPEQADELSIKRQIPLSLVAPISPPLGSSNRHPRKLSQHGEPHGQSAAKVEETHLPNLAAIEAGEAKIKNHLKFFSESLARVTRLTPPSPCLSNSEFVDLYQRNQHDQGHHFVIHQHDHPVAGVHYDLRLQISKSSSISFAIMYGLPGNPNSMRLSRNATETRVHNLWVWILIFPVCIMECSMSSVHRLRNPAISTCCRSRWQFPELFRCLFHSLRTR